MKFCVELIAFKNSANTLRCQSFRKISKTDLAVIGLVSLMCRGGFGISKTRSKTICEGAVIQYGILDDEGAVVRWVWSKPGYPHIIRKVPRRRKPKINLSQFEPAPF
jgi:hypothetical protein